MQATMVAPAPEQKGCATCVFFDPSAKWCVYHGVKTSKNEGCIDSLKFQGE